MMIEQSAQLKTFLAQVSTLTRHVTQGQRKPHKLIMLLSVLDLYEQGVYTQNRVVYNQELVDQFKARFKQYAQQGDLCQPTIPFFHLRSSEFWLHQVKGQRGEHYAKIKKMGASQKWITDNIEYAYFSEEAFAVVSNKCERRFVKEFIDSILVAEAEQV